MTRHRNHLLAALARDDLNLLEPHLSPLVLERRHAVETPSRIIDYVYFVETAIASVVAVNGKDERIEVGLIGCEGMSGVTVVMGDRRTVNSTYIQVPGEALRIEADVLRDICGRSRTLHGLFLRFAQVFMTQTAQTAVANGRAKLEERLARWLLMAHDRTLADEVPLTHEILSVMLGVRRASVTVALDVFEKRGLISARRGSITIAERKGLEDIAGSFYGVPEAEFERLIGVSLAHR
jgi:CRP-like cAMP-binding protein